VWQRPLKGTQVHGCAAPRNDCESSFSGRLNRGTYSAAALAALAAAATK